MKRQSKFLLLAIAIVAGSVIARGSSMAAKTFYIDFASGNDSNAGTSQAAPWKHAPGMQGGSGLAAAAVPQPGDRIIFKGGVTWDHTAFQWNLSWNGTAGNPIYIGADTSWYVGSSFTRPIFNGDHAALAAGNSLVFVGNNGAPNYITLDNIELKGLMAFTNLWPALIFHSCAQYFVMQNLYVHDWTLAANITIDDAHGGIIGNYPYCRPTGTKIAFSHISNTEARDAGRQNGAAVRATDVENSTINDVATAQLFGLVHDSEFFNVSYPPLGRGVPGSNESFDPSAHTNVTYVQGWDGSGVMQTRPAMIYNNVFHDIFAGSGAIYPDGCPGVPYYIFNNVVYNNFGNHAVQIDQEGQSGTCGEYHIWNNTLQVPRNKSIGAIRQVGRNVRMNVLDIQNNHFIEEPEGPIELNPGAVTFINTNNVVQSNSSAADKGYTAAKRYAPPAKGGSTFGKGKNLADKSIAEILKDILNVERGGVWDVGAYQHAP